MRAISPFAPTCPGPTLEKHPPHAALPASLLELQAIKFARHDANNRDGRDDGNHRLPPFGAQIAERDKEFESHKPEPLSMSFAWRESLK